MQTFLDYYIDGIEASADTALIEQMRVHGVPEKCFDEIPLAFFIWWFSAFMDESVYTSSVATLEGRHDIVAAHARTQSHFFRLILPWVATRESRRCWCAPNGEGLAMFPFLSRAADLITNDLSMSHPDALPGPKVFDFFEKRWAVRPTKELLDLFIDGRVPHSELYDVFLEKYPNIYVDLPIGHLRLNDKGLYLSAIFFRAGRSRAEDSWVAVVGRGHTREVVDRMVFLGEDRPLETAGETFFMADEDERALLQENLLNIVPSLVRFVSLYRATQEMQGRRNTEFLPQIDLASLKKLPEKKQRARRKKRSLFVIEDMRAPEGRFGRESSTGGRGGWQLNHRIEVRGHFRLQPWGPERKLRRLIWVDPYVKGKDKPDRPKMTRLSGDGRSSMEKK